MVAKWSDVDQILNNPSMVFISSKPPVRSITLSTPLRLPGLA